MSIEVNQDLIISGVVTITAAFTGAWAAFRFERATKKREKIEQNIAAANRAIHVIKNLWEILKQFQKEEIEPYRKRKDLWLNMNANILVDYGSTTFNADDLAFLLQTEHANIYSELLVEEHRYKIAVQLIKMRSTIVFNEVFPKFSAADVAVGTPLNENDIEKILGIDVVHELKKITEGIIRNVDEDVISLREVLLHMTPNGFARVLN